MKDNGNKERLQSRDKARNHQQANLKAGTEILPEKER